MFFAKLSGGGTNSSRFLFVALLLGFGALVTIVRFLLEFQQQFPSWESTTTATATRHHDSNGKDSGNGSDTATSIRAYSRPLKSGNRPIIYSKARPDRSGAAIHEMLNAHAYAYHHNSHYGGACLTHLTRQQRTMLYAQLKTTNWEGVMIEQRQRRRQRRRLQQRIMEKQHPEKRQTSRKLGLLRNNKTRKDQNRSMLEMAQQYYHSFEQRALILAGLNLTQILPFACPDDYDDDNRSSQRRPKRRDRHSVDLLYENTTLFPDPALFWKSKYAGWNQTWLEWIRTYTNPTLPLSSVSRNTFVIAVHMRRGDVSPCIAGDEWRYRPNLYYLDLMDEYYHRQNQQAAAEIAYSSSNNTSSRGVVNVQVNVYSESSSPIEPWDEFVTAAKERNWTITTIANASSLSSTTAEKMLTLHLDTSVLDGWKAIMSANVAILSPSSFSIAPAALNPHGIIVSASGMQGQESTRRWTSASKAIRKATQVELERLKQSRCGSGDEQHQSPSRFSKSWLSTRMVIPLLRRLGWM